MSRNVDLTKSLSKQNKDDLRYALDRNLITDPNERRRGFAFLDGNPDAKDADDASGNDATDDDAFDPADHNVDDVVKYASAEEVSAEQVEAIIEQEKAGKNRSTLIEALEEMLEPEDEES